MIDLKRKRYLDPIAHDWLKWVKALLTEKYNRGFRPSVERNGNTIIFDSHEEKLRFLCVEKVMGYTLEKRERKYLLQLLEGLWKNLDAIILATPFQMEDMMKKWHRRRPVAMAFISSMDDILVPYYELVAKKLGGKLVDALHITTCPYCNRQFIYSFKGVRKERPELDHFLPKNEFPIFCLSFYNLIPVCHSCNHEKLEDRLMVNPYVSGFRSTFMITDNDGRKLSKSKIYHLTEKEINLRFEGATIEERVNIDTLGLEDVYNKHTDYVKELIDKSMAYDAYAREALAASFQGVGANPRQVYDFVWGKHLSDAEYEDRPLSKLTKDILLQLDIHR